MSNSDKQVGSNWLTAQTI